MGFFKPNIGKLLDRKNVSGLVKALYHRDMTVRQNARQALAKIGEPAVEPLVIAAKDNDNIVRSLVTWALGDISDPRTVEPLIAALNDTDRTVRQNAAWGLGQIGDARAVDALVAMLSDDSQGVRKNALAALAKIGAQAEEKLIAALPHLIDKLMRLPIVQYDITAPGTRMSLGAIVADIKKMQENPKFKSDIKMIGETRLQIGELESGRYYNEWTGKWQTRGIPYLVDRIGPRSFFRTLL